MCEELKVRRDNYVTVHSIVKSLDGDGNRWKNWFMRWCGRGCGLLFYKNSDKILTVIDPGFSLVREFPNSHHDFSDD